MDIKSFIAVVLVAFSITAVALAAVDASTPVKAKEVKRIPAARFEGFHNVVY